MERHSRLFLCHSFGFAALGLEHAIELYCPLSMSFPRPVITILTLIFFCRLTIKTGLTLALFVSPTLLEFVKLLRLTFTIFSDFRKTAHDSSRTTSLPTDHSTSSGS
jgi:hypothetical protein